MANIVVSKLNEIICVGTDGMVISPAPNIKKWRK